MDEFEKFKKKILRRGYRIIRTDKKDFGERLIGEWERGLFRTNRRILIHHFCDRMPTVTDFASFVKDFEDFIDKFGGDYDIEAGYFLTYGEYDKQGFKFILDRVDEDIRACINIVSFKVKEVTKPEPIKRKIEQIIPEAKKIKIIDLKKVVNLLENFKPLQKFKKEREAEIAVAQYLERDFPELKTQQYYGKQKIDVEIGKIGIEIKLPKGSGDMSILRGQIMRYLKHFDHGIALIFNYHLPRQEIESFKTDMKKHFNERVTVIEKS